jgi:aspartyl-tRNA(Asn)/glutamyl-tRNA(Gln) amidotransferase subunit A
MVPMNDNDLAFSTIEQVGSYFRRRALSPVELVMFILGRIEQLNPKINAYVTVTAELALAQAKQSEAELFGPHGQKGSRDRGPLHGVPISLKDNIYTKDVRTTAGSAILKDFVPLRDAKVVAQLKEAGAVILGKTNMHEFAYGVTSNNPHYGPVHNPWNLECIAGGSSGGSAAAVAAGLCYGGIGTDTGGSIRIPAALCGVVGLKPGVGRVSAADVIPLSPTLDFVGPLARNVRDTTLLLDPLFTRGKGEQLVWKKRRTRRKRFRLGVPKTFFFDLVSPQVEAVFQRALRRLEKRVASLCEVNVPMLQQTEDAGNQIAWAEATHYHQQSGWFPGQSEKYGEDVRVRLEAGTKVAATSYLRAVGVRDEFLRAWHLALVDSKADVLAFPTTPIAAPRIGQETTRVAEKEYSTRALLLRHNRPANLAGVPALTLPCGFTEEGLPVGLQLVGVVTKEPLLLEMAHFLESELAPESRRPSL